MNHIPPPGWFPALIVALLLHATIAVAMLLQAPTSGTPLPGVSGMQVGLAASGGALGEVAEVEGVPAEAGPLSPETAETVTAEPVAEAMPAPEPAVAAPEAAAVPAPAEATSPAPQPVVATGPTGTAARVVTEGIETADATPEPVTEAVAAVSPPPLPVPRPRPEVVQTAEPREATAVNVTTPASRTGPAVEAVRTGGPGEAVQQAALVTGGGGRSGDRSGAGKSSQGGTRSGGGSPGERQDYLTRLLNWLERHKEYPRRAQRRRQEGTAMLFFRMDRDGRVTEFRIEKGSGHALLDAEVEAMIQRAQPLPAMPDFMPQSQLELVVPVKFALR
ncbi:MULTISPECIES: TonB family protein [unclassified Minwuia]|jgi:periplasmic protein TonB|uniref:energy transducer TonB n=1 Tax=unclassified Minwuia TaxID=2618799 RepID=UPI0024795CDD|nr:MULTISPECIES: TonB family protein [unclassified Minwuia]